MTLLKTLLRWLLAGAMIFTGIKHFTNPAPFESIVPAYLPAPALLVAASGVAEIAGGAGLLLPPLRRSAAWGLVALYVAVFPANINMALHPRALGMGFAPWQLWLRLPLQIVLIAWAYWFTHEKNDRKKADDPAAAN